MFINRLAFCWWLHGIEICTLVLSAYRTNNNILLPLVASRVNLDTIPRLAQALSNILSNWLLLHYYLTLIQSIIDTWVFLSNYISINIKNYLCLIKSLHNIRLLLLLLLLMLFRSIALCIWCLEWYSRTINKPSVIASLPSSSHRPCLSVHYIH